MIYNLLTLSVFLSAAYAKDVVLNRAGGVQYEVTYTQTLNAGKCTALHADTVTTTHTAAVSPAQTALDTKLGDELKSDSGRLLRFKFQRRYKHLDTDPSDDPFTLVGTESAKKCYDNMKGKESQFKALVNAPVSGGGGGGAGKKPVQVSREKFFDGIMGLAKKSCEEAKYDEKMSAIAKKLTIPELTEITGGMDDKIKLSNFECTEAADNYWTFTFIHELLKDEDGNKLDIFQRNIIYKIWNEKYEAAKVTNSAAADHDVDKLRNAAEAADTALGTIDQAKLIEEGIDPAKVNQYLTAYKKACADLSGSRRR